MDCDEEQAWWDEEDKYNLRQAPKYQCRDCGGEMGPEEGEKDKYGVIADGWVRCKNCGHCEAMEYGYVKAEMPHPYWNPETDEEE